MKDHYNIPTLPLGFDFESKAVLKQLSKSSRSLAELKGVAPEPDQLQTCPDGR